MALQRPISGIAWFLLAAAGVWLLRPELFPDLALPAPLAAPDARGLIGLLLALVAVALAVAAVAEHLRARTPKPSPATAFAGPMLGAEPVAAPVVEASTMAERSEAQAVQAARSVLAAHPDDVAAKAGLAEALTHLGVHAQAEGRMEPALENFEEALGLRRELAGAAPEAAGPADALATAFARLGDAREAAGQPGRAHELYAEAVKIAERLSWLQPSSEVRREQLFDLKRRLAALTPEPVATPG